MSTDYYEVLGIDREATPEEIKRAYKRLATEHHPDKNNGDAESEEKFKEIAEAYSVLSDSEKKFNYDSLGNAKASPFNYGQHHSAQDLFDIFRGHMQGGSGVVSDLNLAGNMSITLEQAFNGMKAPLSFKRDVRCTDCKGTGDKDGKTKKCPSCNGTGATQFSQGFFSVSKTCEACWGKGKSSTNPCKRCHGNGRVAEHVNISVDIPPGVDSGAVLKVSGKGNSDGNITGDMFISLTVSQHPRIKRAGVDLHMQLNVPAISAILGGVSEVSEFFGITEVKIPAGAQNGDVVTVPKFGMPKDGKRGNLHAHINIEIPTGLSDEERGLYERIRDLRDNDS